MSARPLTVPPRRMRMTHDHVQTHAVQFSTHNWRRVPTPPPQARLLRAHLRDFPAAPGGRIFAQVQGGELASITYRRPWAKARHDTLSAAEAASPLAGRVYDLRHACVSTWLNGGIPPAQVAERAGHSVAILLKIYAKCLDGQDDIAKRRIEEALGDPGDGAESPGAGGSAEDFGTCQVRHIKFGVKFGTSSSARIRYRQRRRPTRTVDSRKARMPSDQLPD